MKAGVPALNVIISVFYMILAGFVAYWLKLSHKKGREWGQNYTEEQLKALKKEVNFDRLFALSWFKKYSFVGTCLNENRKYLVKEFFIMSIYAVTCLKINRVILWPAAFSLFLLPFVFVVLELLVPVLDKNFAQEEAKAKNQTVNNMY